MNRFMLAALVCTSLSLVQVGQFNDAVASEISFTSHTSGATVQKTGETLFGQVSDPSRFTKVEITIQGLSKTHIVDVGAKRGGFAFRIFRPHFHKTGSDQLVVNARAIDAETGLRHDIAELVVNAKKGDDGLSAALNRISFGATPELYNHVQDIGFEAYVRAQLNPDEISDARFIEMGYKPELDAYKLAEQVPHSRSVAIRENVYNGLQYGYNLGHALYSERQLNEVMTRFWANHFHTARGTSRNSLSIDITEWNGFRELALSSFEELLQFSASTPSMQLYLDNRENRKQGANENYARELLELHTVGVDGGYGDEDIIEVAKVFTGWGTSFAQERIDLGSGFKKLFHKFNYVHSWHVTDDKFIPFLADDGHIAGRSGTEGVEEGRELLSILANHPKTQAFVCGKIIDLLITDFDRAAYENRCVKTWQETDGQIKPILEEILLDTNFINDRYLNSRTKARNGLEYAMMIGRAFDIRPVDATATYDQIDGGQVMALGNSFYALANAGGYDFRQFATPDGLPENGDAWINTGTMAGKFKAVQELISSENFRDYSKIGIFEAIEREGLETAEEVASYLLAIPTADRYSRSEYKAVLRVLKDENGEFDVTNEQSLRKGLALIALLPSVQLQ